MRNNETPWADRMLSLAAATLGLVGLAGGCAAEVTDPGQAGGVSVSALVHSDESDMDPTGVIFVYLEGHRRCPEIARFEDGQAWDEHGRLIGPAVLTEVRDGRVVNDDGGANGITTDAFFDNIDEGPFTVCARPAMDRRCMHECGTGRAFGNAHENRKTHVDVVMTCQTDGTQDVGSVAYIQHEPQIDVQSAIETGLVACGDSTTADILSVGGIVDSPDGTATEYRLDFIGPVPSGITLNPSPGLWYDASGGFMASLANASGLPASVTLQISGRSPSLEGGYLYAEQYQLTFEWLECE